MKPIVLLVHGFNVFNPEESVGRLRTFFEAEGCRVIMVDYGHTGIIETRLKNPKIAKRIVDITSNIPADTPVIVVGHSNGCAIIHMASQFPSARIDLIVYINPALASELSPGIRTGACHVWHSPSDKPVKWAKRLSRLIPTRWFNARPWGEMGATGYTGYDKSVTNFNKETDFQVSSKTHSDVFQWDLLPVFGHLIVENILNDKEQT